MPGLAHLDYVLVSLADWYPPRYWSANRLEYPRLLLYGHHYLPDGVGYGVAALGLARSTQGVCECSHWERLIASWRLLAGVRRQVRVFRTSGRIMSCLPVRGKMWCDWCWSYMSECWETLNACLEESVKGNKFK